MFWITEDPLWLPNDVVCITWDAEKLTDMIQVCKPPGRRSSWHLRSVSVVWSGAPEKDPSELQMAGKAERLAAESEWAQREGGPAFHSLNEPREIKCNFLIKLKDNRKYKEKLVNQCV